MRFQAGVSMVQLMLALAVSATTAAAATIYLRSESQLASASLLSSDLNRVVNEAMMDANLNGVPMNSINLGDIARRVGFPPGRIDGDTILTPWGPMSSTFNESSYFGNVYQAWYLRANTPSAGSFTEKGKVDCNAFLTSLVGMPITVSKYSSGSLDMDSPNTTSKQKADWIDAYCRESTAARRLTLLLYSNV